jgi:uncharacterized protein (DUF305 family)
VTEAAIMTEAAIRRRLVAKLLAAGLALSVTGCSTAPPPDPPAAPDPATAAGPAPDDAVDTFNAVDVMFLQLTLEQHALAAELTRLAADRAIDETVRTLAAAIEVTQADEAHLMTGWLTSWGQPVDADPAARDTHGGHDALRGTTDADLALLAATPADEFDRTLLNILIAHQHNAVRLARMARDAGADPQVREFAGRIDQSRTAQIAQMLTMLR